VKKTSLYLDPELDAALAKRAEEEGLTKAELIRRTLAGAVHRPKRPKPSIGVFSSGIPDLSENLETKYLEGFGEDPGAA
jgi:hypothetical protein